MCRKQPNENKQPAFYLIQRLSELDSAIQDSLTDAGEGPQKRTEALIQ
jgi:hypothetical protein